MRYVLHKIYRENQNTHIEVSLYINYQLDALIIIYS